LAAKRRNASLRTYSEILQRFDGPHGDDAAKLADLMREIALDETLVRSDIVAMQEIRAGEGVISKLQGELTRLNERLAGVIAEIGAMPTTADKSVGLALGKTISDQTVLDMRRFTAESFRAEIERQISADNFQIEKTRERVRQAKLQLPRIFDAASA